MCWTKEPPFQAEFDGGLALDKVPMTDVEVAMSYLASIPARMVQERLQIKPSVACFANFGHVFSVARGDSLKVFP